MVRILLLKIQKMHSASCRILLVFILFLSIKGYPATIKGTITDKRNGEPLPGVVVVFQGTAYSTSSGLDGSYVIRNVPTGAYDLEVNFTSFETYKEHVVLTEGDVKVVNVLLNPAATKLGEVEIKAKHKDGSDEEARNMEKSSDNLMNIISARTIEILPDITVANVLQRVSGVSLQRDNNGEGRYAIIRGMDKRYNYTTVNGIKIPSTDDKMRYVPMDIFPAEIVDRVEVIKTLTPSMEGDAIGGAMNLAMKNAPDHAVIYASVATGANQTLLDGKYQSFSSSGKTMKDPSELHGVSYVPTEKDFQRRDGDIKSTQAPPNGLMSLTLGNRFLKDKKLGAVFSGSYQNTYKGSNSIFFLPSIQPGVDNAPAITDLEIRKYSVRESRTGLHTKLDYQFNSKNSISLYGLYLQLDQLQNRNIIDTTVQINRTGAGTGPVDITNRTMYSKQVIENITVQGKHLIIDNLKIDYSLVYSKANKDVPDMAELHTFTGVTQDANGQFVAQPLYFKSFSHSWERTTDEDHAAYMNITYAPTLFGKNVEFMAGGMYRSKNRSNYYNDYSLKGNSKQPFYSIYDAYMAVERPTPDTSSDLSYTITEDIAAGYAQAKVTFGKLRILVGARMENTHLIYTMKKNPDDFDGAKGEYNYTDVLPGVHLRYALGTKSNLRLSYNESISRPGFFEVVPYTRAGEEYTESGNPNLNHTVAQNFDLRYEWFPKGIDQLLAGVFLKSISNPIEYAVVSSGTGVSKGYLKPTNLTDKPATNYGFELQFTKFFHYFGVSGNYTYTHSEISDTKYNRVRDTVANGVYPVGINNHPVAITRSLQGQSAHIANLSVIYKNPVLGLDAHISWVYTGRRIAYLSIFEGLDYWQKATSFFDFSCEKRIIKHLSVYAKVNNIFDTKVITELVASKTPFVSGTYQLPYQTLSSNTLVQKDDYGRNYLIGIRYKFD